MVLLGLLGVLGLAPAPTRAQPSEPLRCTRDLANGMACELDASDQFDRELRAIVENGFTNEFVYRVYLFPIDDDEPAAVSVVVFAALFQLYTDVYYISREGVAGYVERSSWSETAEELSTLTVSFEGADTLAPGQYFAAAVLEVNPVNEAQLFEARRWIAQSRGGFRLFETQQSSLFGTFVSLFVNVDLGSADARRVFRSEPFEVGP